MSCAHHDPNEILVGAYLSLSGSDSSFGSDTREGIVLAVEEVNAAGGVRGKRVRVIYEDDKSTTQEASQKVRQLIDRDHVVALLGEVASSRSLAGGLIANTSHVPMITPSSTAVSVTQGRDWVFRTCFTDAQQGAGAAKFVIENLGRKRIGIFYAAQDTYSSGLAASFRDEVRRRGGSIVVDKGYQKGETSYRTHLAEIRAAEPDVVFVPNYYNEMVLVARQAAELGFTGDMFIGGDGWDSENLIEGGGAAIQGAYMTSHYAPDVPSVRSAQFIEAFRKRWHHTPVSLTAQGYDAARLLFDAIERSTDGSPLAIKNALAATKGYEGATGEMTIGPTHNAAKPVVVVQVRGHEFAYVTQIDPGPPTPQHAASVTAVKKARPSFLEALVAGLTQGAMIALVALGYTMVYGVLRLINFAHSEVFMIAAYLGLFALTALLGHVGPLAGVALAMLVAMIGAAALGVAIERIAYRPLRGRGRGALARVTPLVTALGMSVLLQNVAQLLFSARFRPYPQVLTGAIHVGSLAISTSRVVILVAAVVVMIGLELLVKRTWFGKSMRALSANQEAARLMGIPTSLVIAKTFAIGSALAALGAVLFCLDQSEVYPTMGVLLGTRAFVAAVLGGIGSITGAMLGGLVIGTIGELVKLTDYSGGVDVIVFFVLIAVLLVRPAGLLGSTRGEKV